MDFDKETQVRILQVAAGREDGKTFEELDERIAHIMDLHPEFDEIWKQGELATYPQEINGKVVSPFVHTVLHVTVDRQITLGQPEFVPEAYNRLIDQGMEEHHALHAVMSIYAELHFANLRKGQQFDTLDYQSRLQYLSYEDSGSEGEG
ncbi:MAG: DUF1841 family protein [Nitrospinae bacterium]|jgi:hypothetical protein|nr:DUF1841 family protein [Nitrospinota bacterium]MDA1109328.1 DUF1841 family protein [Nitrospinota bacterium]